MSEPASPRLCHYRESALSEGFTLEIRAPTLKVLEEIKGRFPALNNARVVLCNDRQFKLIRSGLTREEDLALIAGLQKGGNIEREGEGVEVMLALLKNSDLSIDTRDTTEEQRVGWIKECIEKRPDLIEDICELGINRLLSTLGITTPNHIVEILLVCAAVDPLMAAEGLRNYATSLNGEQQLSIMLACARAPPVLDWCVDLMKENLSSPQRLKVALVCANTLGTRARVDGTDVAIWRQIPGFTLLDPQQKFEVIKLCAEIAPESTALGLDALPLDLDESQCDAIAQICLANELPVPGILVAAQYIRDPQQRVEIAKRCLECDPHFPIALLGVSEADLKFQDLSDSSLFASLLRKEKEEAHRRYPRAPGESVPEDKWGDVPDELLAQQYARKDPATLFRLLANFPLPDDTLKKILPLCIPQACEQVLENLVRIQMGNTTRFEMALKCAQENPQLTEGYIDRLALTEPQQLELREFCKFMKEGQ